MSPNTALALRGHRTSSICLVMIPGATVILVAGGLLYFALLLTLASVACGTLMAARRFGRRRGRRRRERARLFALRELDTRRGEYRELRATVDRISFADPALATMLELEELLDRFVGTAITQHRYARVGAAPVSRAHVDGLQGVLVARRLAHRDACLRVSDELDDELGAIRELVGWIEHRIECPLGAVSPAGSEIRSRMAILDDLDFELRESLSEQPVLPPLPLSLSAPIDDLDVSG